MQLMNHWIIDPFMFSTTVSENNRLDLDQLLSIEGLVFKIKYS